MSPEPAPDAATQPPAEPTPQRVRRRAGAYAPQLAVLAVAGAAVAAAFMGTRPEGPAQDSASSPPPARRAVVRAPPLVVEAPPLRKLRTADRGAAPARSATRAMGAAPACERCGVVESVAVAAPGQGFRMHIRMDDGTLRTLEQRGALAAGTRVEVDGGSVRLMPS